MKNKRIRKIIAHINQNHDNLNEINGKYGVIVYALFSAK